MCDESRVASMSWKKIKIKSEVLQKVKCTVNFLLNGDGKGFQSNKLMGGFLCVAVERHVVGLRRNTKGNFEWHQRNLESFDSRSHPNPKIPQLQLRLLRLRQGLYSLNEYDLCSVFSLKSARLLFLSPRSLLHFSVPRTVYRYSSFARADKTFLPLKTTGFPLSLCNGSAEWYHHLQGAPHWVPDPYHRPPQPSQIDSILRVFGSLECCRKHLLPVHSVCCERWKRKQRQTLVPRFRLEPLPDSLPPLHHPSKRSSQQRENVRPSRSRLSKLKKWKVESVHSDLDRADYLERIFCPFAQEDLWKVQRVKRCIQEDF